jgi:hypothetical protein
MVDLVPRYPTIDNEVDERAVNLDRSGPIWRKISERSRAVKSTGAVLERQLTVTAAAAGGPIAQLNPPAQCSSVK